MACDICDGSLKENFIYENDKIIIALAQNPCTSGHLQIFPKSHHTIIEELPDDVLSYLSSAANKVSMVLFEGLKVHGTNILIENGIPAGQRIPHLSVHIIPRRTDDGLKLDWEMKQASRDSLDSMQRIISEGMVLEDSKPAEETIREDVVANQASDILDDETEAKNNKSEKKVDYWVKSLERIP
ncbi:MAG: HIT family protein [Candidatus Woesearchaeota archaeon]